MIETYDEVSTYAPAFGGSNDTGIPDVSGIYAVVEHELYVACLPTL